MLGAIIGDIIGSRFEFNNIKTKEFELFTEYNDFTDDTVMTCAVAKAFLNVRNNNNNSEIKKLSNNLFKDSSKNLSKEVVEQMQHFGKLYPYLSYGNSFHQWLYSSNPQPYNSYGNGAAMRISPVTWVATKGFFSWISIVTILSNLVTEVTHNHPEGLKGADIVAKTIFSAKYGLSKDTIKKQVEDWGYNLDFTLDQIRPTYEFNETCQGTVPQAIQCFLESTSFEDAIRNAISIGGDSDTIACITGGIAEAYYGIPKEIKEKALNYLDDNLRGVIDEFYKIYNINRKEVN